MSALFALILLAQADGKWIDLEICQVDFSRLPHVARRLPARDTMSVWITNRQKPGILDIVPKPEGLECVQIMYRGQSVYVIGTRAEIKRKLDE